MKKWNLLRCPKRPTVEKIRALQGRTEYHETRHTILQLDAYSRTIHGKKLYASAEGFISILEMPAE